MLPNKTGNKSLEVKYISYYEQLLNSVLEILLSYLSEVPINFLLAETCLSYIN